MKNFVDFINEGKLWNIYRNNKTTLYFPNTVTAALFIMELSGQISDGEYENCTPSDHWVWVTNCDCKLSHGDIGYNGPDHRIRYSLSSLIKYIDKNDPKWDWTTRILSYAQFASILNDSDFNELINEGYYLRSLIEHAETLINSNNFNGVDDMIENAPKYITNAAKHCILFTDDNVNKWLKNKDKYTLKDLKADNALLSEVVNNKI